MGKDAMIWECRVGESKTRASKYFDDANTNAMYDIFMMFDSSMITTAQQWYCVY
jgi:hypothetical protein